MSIEPRQQLVAPSGVSPRVGLVARQRVEEPQRRVGRVVQALALALREQVRDQAVADVMRERAEDVAGLAVAPGDQRQALEAIIVSRPQSVNQ